MQLCLYIYAGTKCLSFSKHFKRFLVNENERISIQISPRFVPHCWNDNKVKGKVTVLSSHPGSELCSADFDKYLPWSLGLYTPYPYASIGSGNDDLVQWRNVNTLALNKEYIDLDVHIFNKWSPLDVWVNPFHTVKQLFIFIEAEWRIYASVN